MRGCEVRILLDSCFVDRTTPSLDNYDTVRSINELARGQGLPNLEAKLMVLKGLAKLHNKGVIVDSELTLVSSINRGQGVVFRNREAWGIIHSPEVADYVTRVFLQDWDLPERPAENPHAEPPGDGIPVRRYLISTTAILLGCCLGKWTSPS